MLDLWTKNRRDFRTYLFISHSQSHYFWCSLVKSEKLLFPLSFALCFSKCRGNFSASASERSVIAYSFQFPLGMFKVNRLLSTWHFSKSFQQTVQIQFSYNFPPFTFFYNFNTLSRPYVIYIFSTCNTDCTFPTLTWLTCG